jgi:hypothetical protein
MEPFDAIVRKKELVVAIVGRHGAFWTCQEEGACCCYGHKEWSLLDMVRKTELLMQWSEDGSYLLLWGC